MDRPWNILLVNPWIYDFTAYDFWLKPAGLLSAAAYLAGDPSFRLSFIDCLDRTHPALPGPSKMNPDGRGPFFKEPVEKPPILRDVPRRFSRYGIPLRAFENELDAVPPPDAVLITCTMTYWYPGVQEAVARIRRRFGGVPVILGGTYATLCPDHARAHSGADIVAVGPAESSLFPALREAIGAAIPSGPHPPRVLDAQPTPAFGLLRNRDWLPLLTSRGCPFRCTFCAGRFLAPEFEHRSPDSVVAEIAGNHALFATSRFAFYDDALLVKKERHIVPILERVAALGLPVRFDTPNGLHIREIDEPLARLFKRAGVASLYLSLESSDDVLTRERAPKTSSGDLTRAVEALKKAGYDARDVRVYLIMGLPGQGTASVEESIRFVRALGASPKVAFFSPIPGTPEWAGLVSRGVFAGDTDPLLHNKIAFAYLHADFSPAEFERVRLVLSVT